MIQTRKLTVTEAQEILRAAYVKYIPIMTSKTITDDDFAEQNRQDVIEYYEEQIRNLVADAREYNYEFEIKEPDYIPDGEEYLFHILPRVWWSIEMKEDGSVLVRNDDW